MTNRSIDCPSMFDGLNFLIWKVKMSLFLRSQGSRVDKAITKEFVELAFGDNDTWSDSTIKEYEANAKASYALMQAINDDDLSRVINCTSACDIWQCLIITHEGTSQVKKVNLLNL